MGAPDLIDNAERSRYRSMKRIELLLQLKSSITFAINSLDYSYVRVEPLRKNVLLVQVSLYDHSQVAQLRELRTRVRRTIDICSKIGKALKRVTDLEKTPPQFPEQEIFGSQAI